jgi:hypothetical protein
MSMNKISNKAPEQDRNIDPNIVRQISDFNERMRQITQFYQSAVVFLAADRIAKEQEPQSVPPNQVFYNEHNKRYRALQIIPRVLERLVSFLQPRRSTRVDQDRQSSGKAQNTVIDVSYSNIPPDQGKANQVEADGR